MMESSRHSIVLVNGIAIHVAEKGSGRVVLLLHGFPDLWYTWRHQIAALADLGYRAIAPDLRGYGDSDAPAPATAYSAMHIVGDLIGLLDALAKDQEKVFVVGHDWGSAIAWYLCLFRPDRVIALVNMSVPFPRRNPTVKTVENLRRIFGDDYYVNSFQQPGEIEKEFRRLGTERVLMKFLTYRKAEPVYLPKEKWVDEALKEPPPELPHWLTAEDLDYYTRMFEKTGFTGGLNYYRALNLNWELTAAWSGEKIKVPVKFMVGDLDLTYGAPGAKEYVGGGGMKKDVPFLKEVVVMKGVGHFIHREKPSEVTQHIHSFFAKFNPKAPAMELNSRC